MFTLSGHSNAIGIRELADGELDHVAGGDCEPLADGSLLCWEDVFNPDTFTFETVHYIVPA